MIILLVIVVFCSAIFRITNMDFIEFKDDEAINLFLASRPIFGHPFPQGGTVSSVGILNPPLFNYILFPFTILSLDPKIISFFIGLINSLAIGLLFLMLRKYYQVLVAFITTILLAFSPWSVLYSRKIWPQDFLLILLVPWLFSLHKLLIDNQQKYWAVYIACSLLLIQLHLPSLFFVILVSFFLLIRKTPINWKYIVIGLILGIIPLLPYINHQFSNNCPDCYAFAETRGEIKTFNKEVFVRPLQLISQGNFTTILGGDIAAFAKDYSFNYQARKLFYLEYLLLPLGMILFWKNYPKLRLFVYATFLLPILYFAFKIVPHMHYFIILTPFLFLFLGLTFAKLITNTAALSRYPSLLLLILLIAVSIGFNSSFFDLINKQKGLSGDYGRAYVINEKFVKDRLVKYENDPVYQEMFLANFMPRSFVHADEAGGRMLYKREETENNLQTLEKRLTEVPVDSRIQLELIAYYTKLPISLESLEVLEEKSETIPGYRLVFEEVNILYQEHLSN